ncbi:hypothetical protein Hanom_Chr03g00246401 [Helianthus anomalus]
MIVGKRIEIPLNFSSSSTTAHRPRPPHTTTICSPPPAYFRSLHMLKNKQLFFLQTAEVWSTSSSTNVCICGPQTADILPLKKQTSPNLSSIVIMINKLVHQ